MKVAKYKVRWKGKVLGEFSKAEIKAHLRSSGLNLLSQVFVGQEWITLKDFLETKEEVVESKEPQSEVLTSIAFFSTGLGFLSIYLFPISLIFAICLFKKKSSLNAIVVLVLSIIMTLLGRLFFKVVA